MSEQKYVVNREFDLKDIKRELIEVEGKARPSDSIPVSDHLKLSFWLIEQLEQAQQENEKLQEIVEKQDNVFMHNIRLAKELEKALQDNRKLIEVVEYYADEINHHISLSLHDEEDEEAFDISEKVFVEFSGDNGQKARDILKEVKG